MCCKCKFDTYNPKLDMIYIAKILGSFLFCGFILILSGTILKEFENSYAIMMVIIGTILIILYFIFYPFIVEHGD